MRYNLKIVIGAIHEAAKMDSNTSAARMLIDFEYHVRYDIKDSNDEFLLKAIGIALMAHDWQKKLIQLIVKECQYHNTRLREVLTFIENEKRKTL